MADTFVVLFSLFFFVMTFVGIYFVGKSIYDAFKKRHKHSGELEKHEEVFIQETTKQVFDEQAPFEEVKDTIKVIKDEIGLIDTKIVNDRESLIKEAQSIKEKKLLIKQYGLELSYLYDKYIKREAHLNTLIKSLEEVK